ncbi:hypothetical protein [Magnetospirillum sp. SS-4]|uniref:hypothetical protein n=1 Tax=Magnetospirillum sp. SS-4 TaxID=2681465 RepID=UPI00137F2EF1|nr:hypothetical protein [Magnetospirillum sp. SS-4]CAA7613735.1 hypothetical protein MTBSS4_100064 [Magnetospirillum sp. SS-4]
MSPPSDERDLELSAQARLAARAAHHFNNALAVIIANLEMAQEDAAAGRPHDPALVETALNAARGAAGTCRKLQDFARPPGAPPSPLALSAILGQLAETSPAIEIDAPAMDIPVMAEESELLATLDALAHHSTAFIREKGRLRVSTDRESVILTLQGDGPPPSPASLPRLFEPLAGHPGQDADLSQAGSMARRAGVSISAVMDDDGRLAVRLRLPMAPPESKERGR